MYGPVLMSRVSIAFLVAVAACGGAPRPSPPPTAPPEATRYREQVAAQIKPLLDAELVSGVVVGLYDVGKLEVHGFGTGPGGKPPDGTTLFELGSVTKLYTAILFADAVQRREVELETPLSELLPPGVTAPIRDKVAITLKHLALHTSGLPRVPPSLQGQLAGPDPYAMYSEDQLYSDLIRAELEATPGTRISYSSWGTGVLGFVLGRKLGGGYAKALTDRVLTPLALKDTFITVPAAAASRRATGTNEDLAPVPPWTFDALAGGGALISTVRDQLQLIELELDAAEGGTLPLRRAMKLAQEPQIERTGDNMGLGWQIDSAGRFWQNGGTGGFRAFVSFDPKTKRGVVILASTSSSLIDRLSDAMYQILETPDAPPAPVTLAGTAEQLAPFVGSYDLTGTKLNVVANGKRLYLEAEGEPRRRLLPLSTHEFWIDSLQTAVIFEKTGDKVERVVFAVAGRTVSATRM